MSGSKMGWHEEIILFESGGKRLVGILTRPRAEAGSGIGVLLLSPGLKHRVGPHRLYVKLARLFASLGLPVFRFDFHGTGDSEGELPGINVAAEHDRIQNGHFRMDARAALEVFCRQANIKSVIACGLCGGAITSVYLADDDRRIEGIIGLQLPVRIIDTSLEFADQISGEFSEFIHDLYLKKVFQLSAWKNLVTGRSEYRLIWKTTMRRLGSILRLRRRAERAYQGIPEKINRIFLDSYLRIDSRVRMIYIFGETEKARYEFEEEFEAICLRNRNKPYEKVILPYSNHEFSPDDSQEKLLAAIEDWLDRHYDAFLRKAV